MIDLSNVGTISRVAGPFLLAKDMTGSRMYELVHVGDVGVIGEIIRLEGEMASIQAYEDTTGIKPGEKVEIEFTLTAQEPGYYNFGWQSLPTYQIKVLEDSLLTQVRFNFWQNILLKIKSWLS